MSLWGLLLGVFSQLALLASPSAEAERVDPIDEEQVSALLVEVRGCLDNLDSCRLTLEPSSLKFGEPRYSICARRAVESGQVLGVAQTEEDFEGGLPLVIYMSALEGCPQMDFYLGLRGEKIGIFRVVISM